MAEKEITAKQDGDKIVIEIPIELLKFAQENRPDFPFLIRDEKAMVKYVSENILTVGEDSETGDTKFTQLLDYLFVDAYENAEEWLESEDDC